MKVTIYDVAREAGVSIAAVSQVMNGKGKISEERRREILAVMERLDYKPSVIASALMGKRTYTIGLLVPDISNPFFAEIARAVEDRGHQLGYSLFICSTDNKAERAERYLTLMQQKRVDGIIIGTGLADTGALKTLLKKSLPLVMIAREGLAEAKTVAVDDRYGGGLAAEHLLREGHRRAAVLTESAELSSSRERLRGFGETWAASGLTMDASLVRACPGDPVQEGRAAAQELLRLAEPPTALFCCNDLLAIGALRAVREAGLRVPRELSIVGFDNTILAEFTDPPLTTVAQPMALMGELAVDALIRKLEGDTADNERVTLRPELIVRGSTGPGPGGPR